MTFEAFWSVVTWLLVPAIGLLGWWVRDIRAEQTKQIDGLKEAFAESKKLLHQRIDDCNADHREAVRGLASQIAHLQAENARLAAEQGAIGKALEKLADTVERIDEKLDVLAVAVATVRAHPPAIPAGGD